jgi:hypothetical protein
MSLMIKAQGRRFLPLRAVPFVTDGLIDLPTIAHMFDDPEAFCDAQHDAVLCALKPQLSGKPLPVPREPLTRCINAAGSCANALANPALAGLVVDAVAVKALHDVLVHELGVHGRLPADAAPPVWNESPVLEASDRAVVLEKLPPQFMPAPSRVNSKADRLERILAAVDKAEEKALAAGVRFDRTELPGTKAQFTRLLASFDRAITARARATLHDHYFEAGLRWKQGSKPKDAAALLKLFGLSP